jgi:hypothetical protein
MTYEPVEGGNCCGIPTHGHQEGVLRMGRAVRRQTDGTATIELQAKELNLRKQYRMRYGAAKMNGSTSGLFVNHPRLSTRVI